MSVFTMKNSRTVSYQTEAERHPRLCGGKVGSGRHRNGVDQLQ